MAVLTVTYQGNTITELRSSASKIFYTSSKYCEDDIILNYNKYEEENTLINRTFSTYTNDSVTTIGSYAFYSCPSLTTVSFPKCTTIYDYAFGYCHSLTTVSFPACTTIYDYAFDSCPSLTTARFPKCTTIGGYGTFYNCTRLKSLYLTNSSVATLSKSNAFSYTPIGGYSNVTKTYGSIYVPASLLASYKAATNWTYFSSRFIGI